jgi:hypothetical protein
MGSLFGMSPEDEEMISNQPTAFESFFEAISGGASPDQERGILPSAQSALTALMLGLGGVGRAGGAAAAASKPIMGAAGRVVGRSTAKPIMNQIGSKAKSLIGGAKDAVGKVGSRAKDAVGSVLPGMGTVGKVVGGGGLGLGLTALSGVLPGLGDAAGGLAAGAATRSGLVGPSSDVREESQKAANAQRADVPGLPTMNQEIVNEVTTRSGMSLLAGQSSEDRNMELGQLEGRQQAGDNIALDIARDIGQRRDIADGVGQERLDLMGQLEALKSSPEQDTSGQQFAQQLGALLGVGLPAALSGQSIQGAANLSSQIGQGFANKRAERGQKIQALEKSIKGVNKEHFDMIGKNIDSQTKLSSEIRSGSKELRDINDKTRELEKSGELDPTQRIRVGNTNFKNLGVSMKGEKFFRAEGAPKMTTDSQKKLGGFVNAQPVIDSELDKIRQVVSNVGAQGDASFSGSTFYTDKNGKRVEVENAAAFLQTTGTNFKALVKEFRTLGALGQDVLDFTDRLVADPTGMMAVWKDSEGGISSGIRTQIDALTRAQDEEFQVFKDNNQIEGLSDINSNLVKSGELKGFSELQSNQIVPSQPDRNIKYTDQSDGKVYLLNKKELNEILKNGRSKRRN